MQVVDLQNLGFGSFIHKAEHSVSHVAHEAAGGLSKAAKAVGPYAEWAGKETWHGAQACAADPTCKAAVAEYGTEAVEAAMALQNLSFGSWLHGAEHTVSNGVHKLEGDASRTFNGFKSASEAAAKKLGPGFKIAGNDSRRVL